MQSTTPSSATDSSLYRRVWRWHFYAGLICLPFLALMAATGAVYLFKDPIESLIYAKLRYAGSAASPALDAEALTAKALQVTPGQPVRFIAASTPGRSAEVGIQTTSGVVGVYVDPATGRVLGELRDAERLTEVVKGLHSLAIVGPWANYWVEIVAGWAIVLVVSGSFLWWPRGRKAGVFSVRGRPAQRTWWRDVHAVTGSIAGVAILFLAVTGMPWSAFWGQQFGRVVNEMGIGLPQYLFGPGPASSSPSVVNAPWVISHAPVPQSTPPHIDHPGHGGSHSTNAVAPDDNAGSTSIGLNKVLLILNGLGVPQGAPVTLPNGPKGTYTAMVFPEDVRGQRVVHLDRYTGAVLADVGYRDYGIAGRAIEWGTNIHTGVQFGWINQLVMLAACLSIIALALSAVVMWWKRRPKGSLAAPTRRGGDGAAAGALAMALLLGLIYPLLGASMLLALLVDALVPHRWREKFSL